MPRDINKDLNSTVNFRNEESSPSPCAAALKGNRCYSPLGFVLRLFMVPLPAFISFLDRRRGAICECHPRVSHPSVCYSVTSRPSFRPKLSRGLWNSTRLWVEPSLRSLHFPHTLETTMGQHPTRIWDIYIGQLHKDMHRVWILSLNVLLCALKVFVQANAAKTATLRDGLRHTFTKAEYMLFLQGCTTPHLFSQVTGG